MTHFFSAKYTAPEKLRRVLFGLLVVTMAFLSFWQDVSDRPPVVGPSCLIASMPPIGATAGSEGYPSSGSSYSSGHAWQFNSPFLHGRGQVGKRCLPIFFGGISCR